MLLRAGAEGLTVLRLDGEMLLAAGLLCLEVADEVVLCLVGVDRTAGVERGAEGVLFTVLAGLVGIARTAGVEFEAEGELLTVLVGRATRVGVAVLFELRCELAGA